MLYINTVTRKNIFIRRKVRYMRKENFAGGRPRNHVAIIDRELANWQECYSERKQK